MTGTLTVFAAVPDLSSVVGMIVDPGYATFVDDLVSPTFLLRFTELPAHPDVYTSFVVLDGEGNSTLASGDYWVAKSFYDTAFFGLPEAKLALLTANLSTIVAAATAPQISTLKSALNLSGNDEGIEFQISHAQTTVHAGSGDDTITGSEYADSIEAGEGNDTIFGGGGGDSIDAGEGDDEITITGGAELGSVHGGAGSDTLVFADRPGSIYVIPQLRIITFNDASLSWLGEWSFDDIEYFRGSAGLEQFYGNSEGMRFEGGGGPDNFFRGVDDFGDTVDYSGEAGGKGIVVNLGAVMILRLRTLRWMRPSRGIAGRRCSR